MNTRGRRQLTELGKFEITLGQQVISYTLRRSLRARLIWLSVRRQNGLTVTVPQYYSLEYLPEYLTSNSRWILRNLTRYCQESLVQRSVILLSSNTVPYLGHNLKVTQIAEPSAGARVMIEENTLVVNFDSAGARLSVAGLLQWLKQQAATIINGKVAAFSKQIGLVYNKISIKEQKSRWGSCSSRKNLNFNWRLIMAPEPVLDYVIIHELCHLREMSHSKKFWNLVAGHCPRWQEHRAWLDDHCSDLNATFQLE